MSSQILKMPDLKIFKENLDSFDYNAYLINLFKDLTTHTQRSGYDGERELVCRFTLDAKDWLKWRKKDLLGGIYNRDLSNYLNRKGILNHYAIPKVNDISRAYKGRKSITVCFGGF